MDILGKHRIAFNNLGVRLFGELEKDLIPELKRRDEEKVSLEVVATEQSKIIKELRNDNETHKSTEEQLKSKVEEQERRIVQLETELEAAIQERHTLQERTSRLEEADAEHRKRTLTLSQGKSLANKENITRKTGLQTPKSNPGLSLKATHHPIASSSAQTNLQPQTDEGLQTEPLVATETDSAQEAHNDLIRRHEILRSELKEYKSAFAALQDKYRQNKNVWQQWIDVDNARREQSKKRRREESVAIGAGTASRTIHGYTTPATSVKACPSTAKPPVLSPNKSFKPSVVYTSPKKTGLFAGLRPVSKDGPQDKNTTDDLGTDIGVRTSKKHKKNLEPVTSPSFNETVDDPVFPSSIPETQVPSVSGAKFERPKSRMNNTSTTFSSEANNPYDDDQTTDGEGEWRAGAFSPTSKAVSGKEEQEKKSPRLPPMPAPPPPRQRSIGTKNTTREGDTEVSPVVIKSEPASSYGDTVGYHLFEQESLDLDDVGQNPATPRKGRKFLESLLKEEPKPEPTQEQDNGRVGWIHGGFRIIPAEGVEETQDMEVDEDEPPVPTLPELVMNQSSPTGIRTDSQLERPKTPEGAARAGPAPPGFRRQTSIGGYFRKTTGEEHNQPIIPSSPPIPPKSITSPTTPTKVASASNTSRKILPHTSEHTPRRKPPSDTGAARLKKLRDAAASVLEDGTDGVNDIEEEKDIGHSTGMTRLGDILNTPAPKSPSLEHLRTGGKHGRSVQSKRSRGGGDDGFRTTVSASPGRRGETDPLPKSKNTLASKRPKQSGGANNDPSKLNISDFRVNPAMNGGLDYAFAETVRNREARKCLPGCIKSCCRELGAFTEAAGLPKPVSRAPRWRSSSPPVDEEKKEKDEKEQQDKAGLFVEKYGKHRDAFPRRRSPPGFWDADFPDTQGIERQNQEAEEMRIRRMEELKKEAAKGSKGRFIYRGK